MSLNSINIFEDENLTESNLITGIQQIDDKLGALTDGLITLKGKSGHGKTALALQIAQECKQSALYLSCEQSESALALRLVARKAGLSLTDLVNKRVAKEDLVAAWTHVAENTPFVHILDGVHGFVSIDMLRDEVKKIKARDGANKVLLVIDSINDWIIKALPSYEGLSKGDVAKKLALELNDVAKEDGFVVLAILQSGRDSDVESAYQYVAETALEINFERDNREDKSGMKKARIKFLKNRVADTAVAVMLDFNGNQQRFTE